MIKRTPVPWVSPEPYVTRTSDRKCILYRSPNHKTFCWTKYTRANFPENLAPPGDGNKSNASAPSIVNNQETNLPLSGSSSAGEVAWAGPWIAGIGYKCVDGNIRGISTASDFTKAEGCLSEPESSHVKWIFVWNGETRFIPHCLRSPDTRSTQRIAANTSTHWMRRYKHLHVSTSAE